MEEEDITPSFEPMEYNIPEDYDPEILDQYLAAQVQLPLGDGLVLGNVIVRKRDAHGNTIGNAHLNAPALKKVHTTAEPEFGPDKIG